jgi:hypothetical protein
VVDTTYEIDTATLNTVLLTAPTYTVTPATCQAALVYKIVLDSDNNTEVDIMSVVPGTALKLKIETQDLSKVHAAK